MRVALSSAFLPSQSDGLALPLPTVSSLSLLAPHKKENNSIMIKLPPVNLTNLDKVNSAFEGEHNAHTKERLATSVTRDVRSFFGFLLLSLLWARLTSFAQGYLEKLIELFHVIEESGNQEQLHTMFNIFKNLGWHIHFFPWRCCAH